MKVISIFSTLSSKTVKLPAYEFNKAWFVGLTDINGNTRPVKLIGDAVVGFMINKIPHDIDKAWAKKVGLYDER
jgi:hypothetical protein